MPEYTFQTLQTVKAQYIIEADTLEQAQQRLTHHAEMDYVSLRTHHELVELAVQDSWAEGGSPWDDLAGDDWDDLD